MHKVVQTSLCLVTALLVWPVFTCTAIVALILRQSIATLLYWTNNGKLRLMCPADAAYGVQGYPKWSLNITSGCLVHPVLQESDLKSLRARLASSLSSPTYKKILRRPCIKFGYLCWEDVSESFNITDHVKVCPTAGSWTRTYTENEMYAALTKLAVTPFDSSKPNWELLVIPKVRSPASSNSQISSALILRMFHGYMDGFSVFRFFKDCIEDISDQSPQVANFTNTFPSTPFLTSIGQLLQILMYGPFIFVKSILVSHKSASDFSDQFSATLFPVKQLEVRCETLNKIRRTIACSSETAFLSSLTSALVDLAQKKKLQRIPASITIPTTRAILPYPDSGPQNRFSGCILEAPTTVNLSTKFDKLEAFFKSNKNKNMMLEAQCMFFLTKIVGLLPAFMVKLFYEQAAYPLAFVMIPEGVHQATVLNHSLQSIVIVPSPSRYYIGMMVIRKEKTFQIYILARMSNLIEQVTDLQYLCTGFERELHNLANTD